MSWTNELYQIYENYQKGALVRSDDEKFQMLPIFHVVKKVQIEIKLNGEGDFLGVTPVDNSDSNTILPDTGKAKTGIHPHPYPLTETFKYIAGDFDEYAHEEVKGNSWFYNAYMEQLTKWCESDYSHKSIEAVLKYVSKGTVLKDCIESRIFEVDEITGNLPKKPKSTGTLLEKTYARFIVYDNDIDEPRTWRDSSLYDSFIRFNSKSMGEKQLCYALGEELPAADIHPDGIVMVKPNAKLFSFKEDNCIKYTGRFRNKEEAVLISCEFSQKMHNALKWLISKQSITKFFDSLTLIVWASGLQPRPHIVDSVCEGYFDDDEEEEYLPDTVPMFKSVLENWMLGYRKNYDDYGDTKIMIMGLEPSSKGRLSISLYSELNGSEYLENIKKWHEETVWYRRINGKNLYNSFNIKDIINCAYGIETNGLLECSEALKTETILKVFPCITQGRKIPHDLVRSLYHKASNPLAYDESKKNHRKVLEVACGMIRKEHIDYQLKGEITMAYNPKETDRNYLYGCLLALADKIERATYENGENRPTNAKRYWNMFSKRPFTTWGIIYDRLIPYMKKLETNKYGLYVKYMNQMDEIKAKFNTEEFINNAALTPLYLLGYHHYNALLYNSSKKEEE